MSFFDDLDTTKTPTQSGFFGDIQQEKHPNLKKAGRIAGQGALSIAENALFPYELAASVETNPSSRNVMHRQESFDEIEQLGRKKRSGHITPQEQERLQVLLQETSNPLNTLGQFKEQQGGIRGLIGQATGLDTEAHGLAENLAGFAGFIKNPVKIIKGAIKAGKLIPGSKQAKELLKFGKENGLTDKQLAPLIHSKRKTKFLGSLGLRTGRAGERLKESEDALGSIYSSLSETGKKGRTANREQTAKLFDSFEGIKDKIKLSAAKSPDEKAALDIIREMTNDFAANGIDPARLMATYQSINKTVNWNAIKGGKKMLAGVKDHLETLLHQLDPKIAKDFKMTNKLYTNLKQVASHISPKKVSDFEKIKTWGPIATGLWKVATTGNPKVLGAILGAKGAQLMATEMLINPHLNSLVKKTLGTLTKTGKDIPKKAILELQKGLEQYPEIYDEFDWNKLKED